MPIFKNGAKDQGCNYRPISLLSPLSKIFEKCLYERLYTYLEKHKIFTPNQYGFKQNSSTSQAVRHLCDEFIENTDKKEIDMFCISRFKKAFDTVDHSILLQKLEKYGIRGLPLQLLQSYRSNRYQYTAINHHCSYYRAVTCGVPQVSSAKSRGAVQTKLDMSLT